MLYKYNILRDKRDDITLKALGNPQRREILDMLRNKPKTTGEMCDHFKHLDRCTVMLHLRVLEKADLIIVKRNGRNRWNYLNPLPIKDLYDRWICNYSVGAIDLLSKIKKEVEGEARGREKE